MPAGFHMFGACNRLVHTESLSPLVNGLPCRSSNVSAPTFGALLKTSGQSGGVDRVREQWKEMNDRVCSRALRLSIRGFVMDGQPDEVLELIRSHAGSEVTRPSIISVTYTTVLNRLHRGQACQGGVQHV